MDRAGGAELSLRSHHGEKKEICHQMNILKTEICHTVLPSYSVMIVLQLCWQSQKKEVWDPDPVIRCRALRGEGEGGVR